jgi:hypothetical protein
VRSRINFWARSGSFQSAGSSLSAVSSSSRRSEVSQSKRPPQQPQRLLDLLGHILQFGAHGFITCGSDHLSVGAGGEAAPPGADWSKVMTAAAQ